MFKKYIALITAAVLFAASAAVPAGAGMDELLPGQRELYVEGIKAKNQEDAGETAGPALPGKYYKVRPGDTLISIAGQFNVSPEAVWAANALADPDHIVEGQVLAIPGNSITHRVAAGETLWNISEKYRVSVKELAEDNNILNENMLVEGQVLNIPGSGGRKELTDTSRFKKSVRLTWPLAGWISSNYGRRDEQFHHGIDIAADQGAAIRASGSGRVIWTGPMGTYGLAVMVDHGDGLYTLYAHTSKILALRGQRVDAGDIIALVGSTGRSTGPHLHLEVRYNQTPLDPLLFLTRKHYA